MRRSLCVAVLLSAAACGSRQSPELAGSPEADRLAARGGLADAAARGPVPLAVAGDPAPLNPEALPALVARGIAGLEPVFAAAAPSPDAPGRLVLWFGPPPGAVVADACAAGPLPTGPAGAGALLAAWCEEDYAVAGVRGTAAGAGAEAVERLVWRTAARLFPDDYGDRYGFNLFGWRVRLGGAFGL